VQGDDGPHFGEGGDAVGDPGGSRAGGGARHGVSVCAPRCDRFVVPYFERADSACRSRVLLGSGWDDCTEILQPDSVFRRAGVYWCATRVVVTVAWEGLRMSRL
jgi:hypothetical protein